MDQLSETHASIADAFERLLGWEVDAKLAPTEEAAAPQPQLAPSPADYAEVRSLFAELAANHVRPVRDFIIDLRWGEANAEWLALCDPALRSLRRAADALELAELCKALDGFSQVLSGVQASGVRTVRGEHRTAVLARYEELTQVMPQAFALDMDRTQREAVIIQSLLLTVPGVKKIAVDKVVAAGLSTLEAMFLATPGDLAATTGIALPLAEGIVQRFRAYRDTLRSAVPDVTRARERERISELAARLRSEHERYEKAGQTWSPGAADEKKALRKARAQTLLDIQVELARLGEVERLAELERLPFEAKLAHIESFLDSARDKYLPTS
jgi:hypothetical protein